MHDEVLAGRSFGRAGLVLIALVAFLLRLAPLIAYTGLDWAMDPNSDSRSYVALARGLKSGCGFAGDVDGKCTPPEIQHTFGYPLFLALFPDMRTALAGQVAVATAVICVVAVFVGRLWGTQAALITAGFLATDIASLVYNCELMSETLFAALLVFGAIAEIWALEGLHTDAVRGALLLVASVFVACAILVRPIGIMVLPLFVVAPVAAPRLNWSRKMVSAALVTLLPTLAVAGWVLRNWILVGFPTFALVGPLNLLYYRAAGTLAYSQNTGWLEQVRNLGRTAPADLNRRAWEIILSHPVAFVEMTTVSFLYLSVAPDRHPLAHLLGIDHSSAVREPGSLRALAALGQFVHRPLATITDLFQTEFDSSMVLLSLVIVQLLWVVLLWAGVIRAVCRVHGKCLRTRALVLCLAIGGALLLSAAGPQASARFRLPAIPFLTVAAGMGWSGALRPRPRKPAHTG